MINRHNYGLNKGGEKLPAKSKNSKNQKQIELIEDSILFYKRKIKQVKNAGVIQMHIDFGLSEKQAKLIDKTYSLQSLQYSKHVLKMLRANLKRIQGPGVRGRSLE